MKRHLEYPTCSVYEHLIGTAKTCPDLTALEYFGAKITYRRLIGEISRCARALTAIGVKKGDSVSICLPNIPQAVYLFYAVNKIGAAADMIHPMSAPNEIIRYMELTDSRFLFAVDLIAEKIESVCERVKPEYTALLSPAQYMPVHLKAGYALKNMGKKPSCEGFESWQSFISRAKEITHNVNAHGSGDDLAAVLYSGGTTGKPKGIMLTNLNFNALAEQTIDAAGNLGAGDRMLSVMPIFHGFGLGVCIHTMLIAGASAVILPKFSANEFDKLLLKYRTNFIAGVPAIYEAMLTKKLDGVDLGFLKCIVSGGDSLSVSTKMKLNELLASHGCKTGVREGYGLTECVTGSCLIPDDSDNLESVGLPYADTFYKVVDSKTDEELPLGETGELILRGPTVMKGYYKDPEETANTLKQREDGHTWLYTGDLGYMDEQGYVYFRQRLKRMIVSGGYNIYPQNIEAVIGSHNDVTACAVVGVPDQIMGETVRACVVAAQGAEEDSLREELMQMLKAEIAAYALPREIRFVSELPRTLVGKVAYNELAAEE